MGYKPFFKEYTTDWDYAVAKMKGSWFQRHLVHASYKDAKSWDEQLALDKGKVTNAEFEPWTVDLTKTNEHTVSGNASKAKKSVNEVNGAKGVNGERT